MPLGAFVDPSDTVVASSVDLPAEANLQFYAHPGIKHRTVVTIDMNPLSQQVSYLLIRIVDVIEVFAGCCHVRCCDVSVPIAVKSIRHCVWHAAQAKKVNFVLAFHSLSGCCLRPTKRPVIKIASLVVWVSLVKITNRETQVISRKLARLSRWFQRANQNKLR